MRTNSIPERGTISTPGVSQTGTASLLERPLLRNLRTHLVDVRFPPASRRMQEGKRAGLVAHSAAHCLWERHSNIRSLWNQELPIQLAVDNQQAMGERAALVCAAPSPVVPCTVSNKLPCHRGYMARPMQGTLPLLASFILRGTGMNQNQLPPHKVHAATARESRQVMQALCDESIDPLCTNQLSLKDDIRAGVPALIHHFQGERDRRALRLLYSLASLPLYRRGLAVNPMVREPIHYGPSRVATETTAIAMCAYWGFTLHDHHRRYLPTLSLWQHRRKERGESMVEEEDILVFKKDVLV